MKLSGSLSIPSVIKSVRISSLRSAPLARLLILLTLGGTIAATCADAQVSFFTPPGYNDGYLLFTADFNNDGKPDILASQFNSSSSIMNLGNGDGTFTKGSPVSGAPLAVADFNGDGKPDVLEQGTGTLLVLLGNDDGTFQTPISTPSGANLTNIAAADLNGDGKADVVGIFNGALLVYIGKGDGTFNPGVSYQLGVTEDGVVLSFGDFNGDGITDIAVSVTYSNDLPGTVLVFLGNGDGTFKAPKTTSTSMYFSGPAVTGDFNGDGKVDLVIGGLTNLNNLTGGLFLLLGNGDGTFQAPTVIIPTGAGGLAAMDVNGDGKLDLILQGGPTAEIYLGNGDGTFSLASNYVLNFTSTAGDQSSIRRLKSATTRTTPTSIAIADFNLDGKLDIATGGSDLLGNGDGTFQGVRVEFATYAQAAPGPEVTGDFEKKGTQDVAQLATSGAGNTAVYNLFILGNNGSGVLSLLHTYTLPGPANAIATADFNGDGNLDLVVAGGTGTPQNWSYTILLGNGDGSFQSPVFYQQAVASVIGPGSITVADFNKDHKPDLAIGAGNQSVAVLLGNGDGTFSGPDYLFDNVDTQNGAQIVLSGDFNGDGNPDILTPGTAILFGNGDGSFQPAVFPSNLSSYAPLFTADFNLDGKPDLLSTNQVALGNGDGTFTLLPPAFPASTAVVAGVADLNGDGIPDLFAYQNNGTFLPAQSYVLLGKGDGTFGPFINVPPNAPLINLPEGVLPANPVFADMNGDGLNDIVFLWGGAPNQGQPVPLGTGVLINTTKPGFQISATALSPATVAAGSSATSTVTLAALNGFNGAVALTCSSGVSGVTCSLNPSSVTPSGNTKPTSMLTINTTTATTPDTYTVTVTGTSGGIQHTTDVAFTVQGAANFTIAPSSGSPTSTTVSAGTSAMFKLQASSTAWSGTVNLACSISPTVTSGPTCTLPGSINLTAGTASPITVTVATTAPVMTGSISWPGFSPGGAGFAWVTIFQFASGIVFVRTQRQSRLAAPLIVLGLISLAGCGGGSSPSHMSSGTPAGTYTVTVNATAGSAKQSTTLTLVVQ